MKRWIVCILAAIGGGAISAALIGGIYFVTIVRDGFAARDKPSAIEARVARAARSLALPAHAKMLINPLNITPDVLAHARAHWADHCATCHANDGSGDTAIGRNLYPKAPDMRAADTQALTDGELYYVVQNGIRLSGMPAWGERVDDDKDSWALVVLIRHLPKLEAEEILDMERMNPKSPDELREQQREEDFLHGTKDQPAEQLPEHQQHH